jgi:hypothetical protein
VENTTDRRNKYNFFPDFTDFSWTGFAIPSVAFFVREQVCNNSVYHHEVINKINKQALEAGEEFAPYDDRWINFWENLK